MIEPRFKYRLQVEFLKGTSWRLTFPFFFRSDLMDDVIEVPSGFVTNFASVPYKTDPRPAVIHDYLYSREDVSRKLADEVFLEAMNETKDINKARRMLRFWAVRLFGGSHK